MADLDASVIKRKPDEVEPDVESYKRPRQDHDDDGDTVSEIAEHSVAGSDHGDELCSGSDTEDDEKAADPKVKNSVDPSKTERYAPFLLDDDKKSMLVRCLHCHTKFRTDLIEVMIKPVDIEVGSMDEIDGGHLALSCNIVFKRRTLVRCSKCDRDVKIANNFIDDAAGEVLGETIRVATQESGVLQKQLLSNITSVERQYTLTSLSTLFGASQ